MARTNSVAKLAAVLADIQGDNQRSVDDCFSSAVKQSLP